MSNSCSNLATAFLALNNFDQALEYINRSLEIDIAVANKKGQVIGYDNKAGILLKAGKLNKALEVVNKGIALFENESSTTQTLIDKSTRILINSTKAKILNVIFEKTNQLDYLEQSTDIILSLIHI